MKSTQTETRSRPARAPEARGAATLLFLLLVAALAAAGVVRGAAARGA